MYAIRSYYEIIFDVSGIAKPGQLIAIMGASGAGKSGLKVKLSNGTTRNNFV